MKTRAAVAWTAGKPLTIEEVDLEGPKAGEVLEVGAGAAKVIGIDLNPAREALGRKFGMTHFIHPKSVPNVVDAIVSLTDGGARGRINEGFALMERGESIRSVVVY